LVRIERAALRPLTTVSLSGLLVAEPYALIKYPEFRHGTVGTNAKTEEDYITSSFIGPH
jgi:hypothetical protein